MNQGIAIIMNDGRSDYYPVNEDWTGIGLTATGAFFLHAHDGMGRGCAVLEVERPSRQRWMGRRVL